MKVTAKPVYCVMQQKLKILVAWSKSCRVCLKIKQYINQSKPNKEDLHDSQLEWKKSVQAIVIWRGKKKLVKEFKNLFYFVFGNFSFFCCFFKIYNTYI